MARCIRLPVADVAVELGARTSRDQPHEFEPVGQRVPHVLRALHVTVHDHGEYPPRKMARIIPAGEFDGLCLAGILAVGEGRIGIAAIGAHHAVHHQLDRGRHLVPVDGGDDHDAMRGNPHREDVVHPVLHLAERVVRITGARPMAQRRRGRETCLAGVNPASVFRGQPRQVEHIHRQPALVLDRRARERDQAEALRHLTRTGMLASRRAVDEENARRNGRILIAALRRQIASRAFSQSTESW